MKLKKASDITLSHMSWLIFGYSKVGKTVLTGTFPDPIMTTNFLNENGVTSLRGHSSAEYKDIATLEDFDEYVEEVLTSAVKDGFKTVVVDSLTSLTELQRTSYMQKTGKMPNFDMWKKWTGDIICLLDRFRDLPLEKVYTATPSSTQDQVDGTTHICPHLFGKLEERVPAKLDVSLYMESRADANNNVIRQAFIIPKGGAVAGARGSLVENGCIENPTYAKVLAALQKPLFD